MLKLFKYLRPFAAPIALVLGMIFLSSLSELYLPTLMADIVDKGIAKGDIAYILRIGGLMLLVAAGRNGVLHCQQLLLRAGRHGIRA